ncbi:MAG: hypothetical protein MN733_42185 [Nitrososphaera sp.]|nr:hypothetical protein [Nitrososphaera sp.]
MAERATVTFQHYGISPWEIEVIYDTLRRSFEVDETQHDPDDPQYVSMIEIGFPLPYDESFFQTFTMSSWHKVKGVIKDIKRRRGRKGLKAFVSFEGTTPSVIFPLMSKGDRQFEMGIEKLEYLVDIVPIQLKSIPPETLEVWFAFDEASYKWSPSVAKSRDDRNYVYKNNEWKSK